MIKYIEEDTLVGFREIPTEIALCVNISNCQNNCVGCHSSYLKKDIGKELNFEALDALINDNKGVTCLCLMGEGNDKDALLNLVKYCKSKYGAIKLAIYSGRDNVDDEYWGLFDYIKVGRYDAKTGALDKPTTNQKLFQKVEDEWRDITSAFWK